jgi:Ca-activated chloride channel family protein
MTRYAILFGVLALAACALLLGVPGLQPGLTQQPGQNGPPQAPQQIEKLKEGDVSLNQGKVQKAPVPVIGDPVPLTTKEGKKGWKITIPGNRPLATPAVVGGKVFLGGGFGSHEFYAFDAATGKKLWIYQTGDDGPTAAVVADGHVAFNTESCELEIITMDGKPVWKKWLGDPLMSMPAISMGKVYMAYPNSKGDKGDRRHYLACFDLKTGQEEWKKAIAGEIITAPVIHNNQLYLATLEGTMYCFAQGDGKLVWQENKNATSSPMVWDGQCYFSRREVVMVKDKDGKDVRQQMEYLTGRGIVATAVVKDINDTARRADYLDYRKRVTDSAIEVQSKKADAGVGFATPPADAKLEQARMNLGQGSVSGVWAYQGSRPFIAQGKLYSCMGDTLTCVDPKTEKVLWKKELSHKDDKQPLVDATLTPPVLVNGKVFLGTVQGEVLCLLAESGEVLWRATIGEPVIFQPAVASGRVYVSTSTGTLFCIETGDARDDGWTMWGGNAAHNGLVK